MRLTGDRFDGQAVLVDWVDFQEPMNMDDHDWDVSVRMPPLMYAWAMTVHFVQGRTIRHQVVVDVCRSWTYGMGYVSMSRSCRWDDLHIVGMPSDMTAEEANEGVFMCSERVKQFYKPLYAALNKPYD